MGQEVLARNWNSKVCEQSQRVDGNACVRCVTLSSAHCQVCCYIAGVHEGVPGNRLENLVKSVLKTM